MSINVTVYRGSHSALFREDTIVETQWQIEEELQAACTQWFWNTYPQHRRTLFHVQQKARNRMEGSRFKAIGVVPGPSDLVFITPNMGTVYIEMKLWNGKQSDEQIDFEEKVTARGQMYLIRRSLAAFQKTIKHLLSI